MKKKEMIRALKALARQNGCTCDPWITVAAQHGKLGEPGSLASLDIAHDEWCGHRRTLSAEDDALTHLIRSMGPRN